MSKGKNLVLIITSIVLVAVLVVLYLGFTNAWFVSKRKAEGNLEFVGGIKIEYSNMFEEEQNPTTKNLKLVYIDDGEDKPLEVSGVTGETFIIKNPTIKAQEGTVPYYVRVKLDISLYYKDEIGNEIVIDDNSREDFLAITADYKTADEEPVVITDEKQLFKYIPSLDLSKFVYFNGWYYLSQTAGAINTFDDIVLTECAYYGENTESISFLREDLNGEVKLALNNSIDFRENMPFSKMEISVDIQAIETQAVGNWA